MRSKIILYSFFILSCFFLSGCTINKNNSRTNQLTPTPINNETGDDSEADILKELNSIPNNNSDSELNQIESELK